jgi:NAD(P)-dependent dehydrogenase (short-subunit alcohol dehydrogenase family)
MMTRSRLRVPESQQHLPRTSSAHSVQAAFPDVARTDHLQILPLDVTNGASIAKALADAGPIEVLVNNAGYAAPAPIELIGMDQARALFETNTFGTLAVTQAVLPAFRERGSGVIINISSSVTLRALPLLGIYRASKAAVNAYTESLALGMKPFGVRIHVVLPGRSPETKFGENAFPHASGMDHPAYAPVFQQFIASVRESNGPITYSSDVAEVLWKISNDPASPTIVAAGADAEAWLAEAQKQPAATPAGSSRPHE